MLLEIGRVVKPHGIRGEVIVALTTNVPGRLAPGIVLSADDRELEIDAARPHQGRWIVAFAGVTDRTGAEALRGVVLRSEAVADDDALWVHELIGAEVVDTTGAVLGRVTSVEANPADDILVLDGGGLVPVTFVVSQEPGRIVVDPPPGLLDEA